MRAPGRKTDHCERFACSQQKGIKDKTPRIKNPIIFSILNKITGYDI